MGTLTFGFSLHKTWQTIVLAFFCLKSCYCVTFARKGSVNFICFRNHLRLPAIKPVETGDEPGQTACGLRVRERKSHPTMGLSVRINSTWLAKRRRELMQVLHMKTDANRTLGVR
jgi:hypothetical protein